MCSVPSLPNSKMISRRIALLSLALLLAACGGGLSGSQEHSYEPVYSADGLEHSMTVTFLTKGKEVVGLRIELHPDSQLEQFAQISFAGGVRQYVLDKNVDETELPDVVGEQKQLTMVFEKVLEELRADLE